MKLTGKKFLLVLFYSPTKGNNFNIPIIGRTRLMKMCFLFKKEILADFKKQEVFKLTEKKGVKKAAEIWSLLTKNQEKLLMESKRVLNAAPLYRIMDYVYKKYKKEGYTDRYLIREKYLSY